jgi:SAM-dependent methyltransferase
MKKMEWQAEAAELPMLDVYMPMMKAAAIISAGRLGLFETLADGPREVQALAHALGASEVGIESLAEFLVAVGYLEKHGDSYANSANTTRWFTKRGSVDYTAGLLWTAEAWEIMSGLTDAVKNGSPEKTLWEVMLERTHLGPIFSSYMHSFAHHLGADLLAQITLPAGPLRLLDLGGSHGLHSIAFCERYPGLNAVIVDMASALTNTAALIAQEKLSDRISLRPGNLLDGDWGDGYDVVFYFSVAHNQSADDNRRVIRQIAQVLRPGGMLVIHEYLAESPPLPFHAAFRLTLLVETATRTYSYREIAGWLDEAGFAAPTRIYLNPQEKGSLLIARR